VIFSSWKSPANDKTSLAPFLINTRNKREPKGERRKEMAHIDSVAKARLKSLSPGKLLKLKDGLYRQLGERQWIFNRMEKNLIFLIHKEGAYGVVVRNEDIDWNDCH
jgi:hypothetical protein